VTGEVQAVRQLLADELEVAREIGDEAGVGVIDDGLDEREVAGHAAGDCNHDAAR
jgi:hypothetical protein